MLFGKNVLPLCRLCGIHDETTVHIHILSEYPKLAQKVGKNTRHDAAKVVHCKLCEKCRL